MIGDQESAAPPVEFQQLARPPIIVQGAPPEYSTRDHIPASAKRLARCTADRSGRVAAALLLAACATTVGPHRNSPQPERPLASQTPDTARSEAARRLDALADEYFRDWVKAYPLFGAILGIPETPNDLLDDNSLAARRAWERKEDRWLERLREIDAQEFHGRPEEATYGVLVETLEAARQTRICHAEYWPLNQQSGFQIFLPLLSQLQPVGTSALRAQALARWRVMPRFIDAEIVSLREGLRRGYTLPRANAEAVLEQLDAILKLPPAESPFAGLAQRDSAPGFRDAVVRIVAEAITPAVRRYRDFLASGYIPNARETTAISALPHGEQCYRASVRTYTTVDLDPRAVFQLGLEQMALIDAEMRAVAERSFGTDDVPALLERLRSDSENTFKTRDEIIQTAEQAVARAKSAMPRWFGRLPKTDFIVEACQPYEEKSGCPNSYVPGTPDGSRPGRYRINAGTPTSQPRAPAEGTAFHEGIPGHHLQISLAQERPNAHPITRYLFFSGFSEGWALYAERLADEMGLYSSDLAKLGDLGEQGLRAARLVVDPGLHVLGWSRQQAIDYMLAHTLESRAVIESEADRYIANPGQATAYMIGRLEIERLRRESEERLGAEFDIREFHDKVLESGSIPLALLRSHIEAWLRSRSEHAGTEP